MSPCRLKTVEIKKQESEGGMLFINRIKISLAALGCAIVLWINKHGYLVVVFPNYYLQDKTVMLINSNIFQ